MDVQTIITELGSSKGLPREALTAASAQREELAPIFIAEIERYVAHMDQRSEPDALFFMFHLLGEWQETSAYPALARFLRLPAEELDRILDDAITVTAHRVMAGVFDGDPQPLYDIILDPDAEEFVRAGMFETLAILVARGRLDRASVEAFLRDCFTTLQPRDTSYVWQGWQMAIARLGIEALTPLVEEAFSREYIEPEIQDFDWFKRDLAEVLASPGTYAWLDEKDCQPFDSSIEEFSKWHGFSDAYRLDLERARQDAYKRQIAREWTMLEGPVRNPKRSVGRNDPCTCGSGQKFKKCCLQ